METDISRFHKGTDGLYYEDFIQPKETGTFIGRLVSTEWWHKRNNFALICDFETEDGQKIALFAFQKETGFYGPRCGDVNFKKVEMNTIWKCEVKTTRTGRCTWVKAEQIVESKTELK